MRCACRRCRPLWRCALLHLFQVFHTIPCMHAGTLARDGVCFNVLNPITEGLFGLGLLFVSPAAPQHNSQKLGNNPQSEMLCGLSEDPCAADWMQTKCVLTRRAGCWGTQVAQLGECCLYYHWERLHDCYYRSVLHAAQLLSGWRRVIVALLYCPFLGRQTVQYGCAPQGACAGRYYIHLHAIKASICA